MIYFISNRASKAVKIGYTANDPSARLRQLQTGHADRLELRGTTPGDREHEKRIHRRFAKYRISGEWFQAHPEVITWIMAVMI